MKNYLATQPNFIPGISGAGTIKLNIVNFDIRKLIAIIDQTRSQLIYGVGAMGFGFTNLDQDTVTLEFDTSGYSSQDVINVIYDSSTDYPVDVNSARSNELMAMVQRLVKLSESLQVVDSSQRQRITLDSIAAGVTLPTVTTVSGVTTVTTVTTVSTVTNVASNAGMDREQYINVAKQTYANSIRANLRFQ